MFAHRFLMWTAPFVAAAVLAFTPAVSTAKPRGGGGHSGGRHAAVHSSGHHAVVHSSGHRAAVHSSGHRAAAHYSGVHTARAYHSGTHYATASRGVRVAPAYRGGRYYANRGNYGRGNYGRGNYGRGYYGRGYYGGGYYGGYGWDPWLGYGLGYPYGYDYSPYVNNYYDVSPSYDYVSPDAANIVPDEPPLDADSYSAVPTSAPAELNVILPTDGVVSIGSFQTAQAAGAHLYETPAINPGAPYSYTIQAQWMDNGRPVTRTKTVTFQAGETIDVDFTQP